MVALIEQERSFAQGSQSFEELLRPSSQPMGVGIRISGLVHFGFRVECRDSLIGEASHFSGQVPRHGHRRALGCEVVTVLRRPLHLNRRVRAQDHDRTAQTDGGGKADQGFAGAGWQHHQRSARTV